MTIQASDFHGTGLTVRQARAVYALITGTSPDFGRNEALRTKDGLLSALANVANDRGMTLARVLALAVHDDGDESTHETTTDDTTTTTTTTDDTTTTTTDNTRPVPAPPAPRPVPVAPVAPPAPVTPVTPSASASAEDDKLRKVAEILGLSGGLTAEQVLALVSPVIDARLTERLHGQEKIIVVTRERDGTERRTDNGIQHAVFPRVLDAVARRRHVWLWGPAGTGKSTVAEKIAASIGWEYFPMQVCETKYDVIGHTDAMGNFATTCFVDAIMYATAHPESGAVFLMDDADGSMPSALMALLGALANNVVYIPSKGVVRIPANFVVIFAANTDGRGSDAGGYTRLPVDFAFRNRFAFIHMAIDEKLERHLFGTTPDRLSWVARVQKARTVCAARSIDVTISPRASQYGADLLDSEHWTTADIDRATWACDLSADQYASVTGAL